MSKDSNVPSIERRAFVGASWLAFFRFFGQLLSWTITILVARILDPADYGLMEMTVIIPGYAMKLGELGLGPAIIQRPQNTQSELSSVFWFSLLVAAVLSAICFAMAPLLAGLFDAPRLLALTQAVSVLFVLQSLQVVPANLLKKTLDFRKIGQIEILAVIVSSVTMLVIAKTGGGVWTLVGGMIALTTAQLCFTFAAFRWLPSLHYSFDEVRSYLRFGLLVSLQGTLFYVYDKSDKFFAGLSWNPSTLGQYGLALQLAQLPSEKITVLINHVSFPTLSLLANERDRFGSFYLNIINICATIVLPLFVGGFLVGSDLVVLILGEKWSPIGPIFEYLCLAQITVSLNAVNNFVHNAQGRASWSLWNTVVCTILISASFLVAVPHGIEAALIPWFTTYIVLAIGWIGITIRAIGIRPRRYLQALAIPLTATAVMAGSIQLIELLASDNLITASRLGMVVVKVGVGVSVYTLFLWIFDRRSFEKLQSLRG